MMKDKLDFGSPLIKGF